MKTCLALGSALALFLVSGVSSATIDTYRATLSGKQAVPANASAAAGSAVFTYNSDKMELNGAVFIQGISTTTGQHLHEALCGASNPTPSFTLPAPVSDKITLLNTPITAAQAAALIGDEMYVNIHSAAFPNGEIRGPCSASYDAHPALAEDADDPVVA